MGGLNDWGFGTLKFLAAFKADLVRSPLNRKHATELAVPASEYEFKNPQQGIHASCDFLRS